MEIHYRPLDSIYTLGLIGNQTDQNGGWVPWMKIEEFLSSVPELIENYLLLGGKNLYCLARPHYHFPSLEALAVLANNDSFPMGCVYKGCFIQCVNVLS